MSNSNFDVTTKEEKMELLKQCGYAVFSTISEYTEEQLDVQIEQYISDMSGFELSRGKNPYYVKYNGGQSDEVEKYILNKYGHLEYHIDAGQSVESHVSVYYGKNKYLVDGFALPHYAYVLLGDAMYCASACGTDFKIEIIRANGGRDVIVDDTVCLGADVEGYLYDFIILREKYLASINTTVESRIDKTSFF